MLFDEVCSKVTNVVFTNPSNQADFFDVLAFGDMI
jgi:hypothetical protein